MSRCVFNGVCVILAVWLISGLDVVRVSEAQDASKSSCQRALPEYRVAVQFYQDGLIEPAIAGFNTYLQQCPSGRYTGQAHYVLATIWVKQTEFAKALSHIQGALAQPLAPTIRPQVLLLGAQSAMQLGKQEVAQQYLQQVVTIEADGDLKAPAFYWLGEMASRKQDSKEAQRYYKWAIQESPQGPYTPPAYYALGWLARQQGDITAALDAFAAFLKMTSDPKLARQVRFAQADLLREQGDIQAAAVAFQQLAQDRSTEMRDEALFRWAELAYQLQQYDDAYTAYDQLLDQFPQSRRAQDARYGQGWAAIRRADCEAAIKPWEALLEHDAQFAKAADVRYHLGMCAIQLQRYAMARRYLKLVMSSTLEAERQREVAVKLATLAFRDQDYPEAIQYYSEALTGASQDRSYRFHYLLGESYYAAGQVESAVTHWEQALEGERTQSFESQVLYRLGAVALAESDWLRAIAFLRRLWDSSPQFTERPAVAAGLARAYGQTQQCEDALKFYAERSGETPTLRVEKGQVACLFALKRYREIVQLLSEPAVSTALEDTLLYTLGQSYMQLQEFELAVQTFERLQQKMPQSRFVNLMAPRYAFALEKVGRIGAAVEAWQRVLGQKAGGDEVERQRLQLHVGRLALQEKRFDVALTWLENVQGTSHTKLGVEALYWSGEVFWQQQQWSSAMSTYLELLQRYPSESHWVALARLRLGMIYEVQKEWDQALEIYQTLSDSGADAEVVANAQRRIGAIKAGRVLRHPTPVVPSKG